MLPSVLPQRKLGNRKLLFIKLRACTSNIILSFSNCNIKYVCNVQFLVLIGDDSLPIADVLDHLQFYALLDIKVHCE